MACPLAPYLLRQSEQGTKQSMTYPLTPVVLLLEQVAGEAEDMTINTKLAMEQVFDWFCSPESDKGREKETSRENVSPNIAHDIGSSKISNTGSHNSSNSSNGSSDNSNGNSNGKSSNSNGSNNSNSNSSGNSNRSCGGSGGSGGGTEGGGDVGGSNDLFGPGDVVDQENSAGPSSLHP